MHIKEKVLKVHWKYKAFKEKKQSANLMMSRVNGEYLMAIAGNTYFYTICWKKKTSQNETKTGHIIKNWQKTPWKQGKKLKNRKKHENRLCTNPSFHSCTILLYFDAFCHTGYLPLLVWITVTWFWILRF